MLNLSGSSSGLQTNFHFLLFNLVSFILGAGNDLSHKAKSVSPDLRTALISLTCGAGWTSEAGKAAVAHAMTEWSERLYRYGTGVYYNEPKLLPAELEGKVFIETMRYKKKAEFHPANDHL